MGTFIRLCLVIDFSVEVFLYLYLHLDWWFNLTVLCRPKPGKSPAFVYEPAVHGSQTPAASKLLFTLLSVRMPPTQTGVVLLWEEMLSLWVKMSKLQLGRLLSLNPSSVSQTECQTASLLQLKIHVSLELKATSPSMSLFPRGIAECKKKRKVKHTQRHSEEAVFPQSVLE